MSKHMATLLALIALLALGSLTDCDCGGEPEPEPVDFYNPATDDSDGDGVPDAIDALPNNSTETRDFDRDGTGDTADLDDDNDGVPDADDAFPLNPGEYVDTDDDGIGDNLDADDDADDTPDINDAFPLDAAEQRDTDGDGSGDNADTDDDGDGAADTSDDFPLNPAEQQDTDSDGIGDNADLDDDRDGIPDWQDAFPLDGTRSAPDPATLPGEIVGQVTLAPDRWAANVTVNIGSRTTVASELGEFRFENVAPGPYTVASTAPGYLRGEDSVTVRPNTTANAYIQMVPGFKLSDRPSVEIVAVVNEGVDLLLFDEGWLGGYRDSANVPPGTLALVNLQGAASRTIAHNVYLGRYLAVGEPLHFSPSRKLLYVKEEFDNQERIRVYNLATASVGELFPAQCGYPLKWSKDETIAYTAGVGTVAGCVVRATGGSSVHEVPVQQAGWVNGFVGDNSFIYGVSVTANHWANLTRVLPADLAPASLARVHPDWLLGQPTWGWYHEIPGNRLVVAECTNDPCTTAQLKRIDLAGGSAILDANGLAMFQVESGQGFVLMGPAPNYDYRFTPFDATGPRALTIDDFSPLYLLDDNTLLHKGIPGGQLRRANLTTAANTELVSGSYDPNWVFSGTYFCFTGDGQFAFTPGRSTSAWVATSTSTATQINHTLVPLKGRFCTTGVLLMFETINSEDVLTAFSIPDGQVIKSYAELTDHVMPVYLGVYGSNDTAFIAYDQPDAYTLERCTVATTGGCTMIDRGILGSPHEAYADFAFFYPVSNAMAATVNDYDVGVQWIYYDMETQQRTPVPYAMRWPFEYNGTFYGYDRRDDNVLVRWAPPETVTTFVIDFRLCYGDHLTGWYFFLPDNRTAFGRYMGVCSYDSINEYNRGSYGVTFYGGPR